MFHKILIVTHFQFLLQVITRGGIIYRWGATTQCPIASAATRIQTVTRDRKCYDPMEQHDKYNQQDINNQQDKNNENEYKDKTSRSYDVNINLFINQTQNINFHNYFNKTNAYLTRNMNQNDKNNYLHKNDPNNTIYDRFSAVHIKPDLFDRVYDVNSIQNEANASDALLDRYLLRVMLPIKVTQQMCPDSHLIAYFYYNGEFVSASKHFEMDDCFVNKVSFGLQIYSLKL